MQFLLSPDARKITILIRVSSITIISTSIPTRPTTTPIIASREISDTPTYYLLRASSTVVMSVLALVHRS